MAMRGSLGGSGAPSLILRIARPIKPPTLNELRDPRPAPMTGQVPPTFLPNAMLVRGLHGTPPEHIPVPEHHVSGMIAAYERAVSGQEAAH